MAYQPGGIQGPLLFQACLKKIEHIGPSWSNSRDVCMFVCLSDVPFHVIFLRGGTGAEGASSVDWCDLDLDLE